MSKALPLSTLLPQAQAPARDLAPLAAQGAKTFRANAPEQALSMALDTCLADAKISLMSPIDAFEQQQRWICKRAFEFSHDEFELGLLVMALTSASESYFRAVLAASILTCPLSHEHNIDKGKFSLRAMSYYPQALIPLALLEHVSFSDADAIRKQTTELLQIDLPTGAKGSSSVATALQEYDKVCALRHALIHSLGLVNSKNCTEAGFPKRSLSRVAVTMDGFQVVADTCLNVVRAFNQFVFEKLTKRLYEKSILGNLLSDNAMVLGRLASVYVSKASPEFNADLKIMCSAIHNSFLLLAPQQPASMPSTSATNSLT